jgi:hypothetical protein
MLGANCAMVYHTSFVAKFQHDVRYRFPLSLKFSAK